MVSDTDFCEVVFFVNNDFDGAAFWCELYGIAEEVSDHGVEHVFVGTNLQSCHILLHGERNFLCFGYHGEDTVYACHHVDHIEVLVSHLQSSGLALCPFQQVVEQVVGFLGLLVSFVDEVKHLRSDGFWRDGLYYEVQHHTNACHRRAQVVGDDGVHFVSVVDGSSQFFVLLHDDSLCCHERDLVHDTHYELFLVEWFGKEVVGSHLETMHEVSRAIECCKEDDGYIGCFRAFLEFGGCVESAYIRHHHIEQNKVGMFLFCSFYTACSIVSREHLELFICKQYLQEQDIAYHVVNHKYSIFTAVYR